MTDADLIKKLQAGDDTAFNFLVGSYRDKVIATCYRFFLNWDDAADVAQDIFVEIFLSVKNFKGNAKLSTWIYRVAVSKCLDEVKKRNRKKRGPIFGKTLHIDEIAGWVGGGIQPDNLLNEKENLHLLATALNTLADNQRIAFTLSKVDGFSNAEIADIMHTTQVAVESLIYRAKKQVTGKLKKLLGNG